MKSIASSLIILITICAPIALGSNRPLMWTVNGIMVAVALALTAIAVLAGGRGQPSLRLGVIAAPMAALAVCITWLCAQLLPGVLSLSPHPAWQVTTDVLGLPTRGMITVNPQETTWSLLKWLTAGSLFAAVYVLARERFQASLLLHGLIAAAVLNACYGLMRLVLSIDRILWFEHVLPSVLTGGFVNPNSAAMHIGIGLVTVFAMLLYQLQRTARDAAHLSSSGRLLSYSSALGGRAGLYLFALIVLIICLLLTGSRAGIVFVLVGIGFCQLCLWARGRRGLGLSSGAFVTLTLTFVIMFLALLELSGVRFIDELARSGLEDRSRFDVYWQTLTIVRDYLLVGSGGGTFQDVYPAYRVDIAAAEVWDKAHNDYAELFAGLGVPVAVVVLAGFAAAFGRCVSGIFNRRRDYVYPAAAASAAVYVGLHSFFDFGIQMQANALAFAVVMGVGLAQAVSSRTSTR